jgi:hypothetical protein
MVLQFSWNLKFSFHFKKIIQKGHGVRSRLSASYKPTTLVAPPVQKNSYSKLFLYHFDLYRVKQMLVKEYIYINMDLLPPVVATHACRIVRSIIVIRSD